MKRIRQLFCNHTYDLHMEPVYLSLGDEYYDRPSQRYMLCCNKCDYTITINKKWCHEERGSKTKPP